jgi:hypothetical protein
MSLITVAEAHRRIMRGETLPVYSSFGPSRFNVLKALSDKSLFAVSINTLGRVVYLPGNARIRVEDK